jgi:hypothetical protein
MSEKLIEEGYFTVGRNKLIKEGDKTIIVNAAGVKSYDWIAGDNPVGLEGSMCDSFSSLRLTNVKKWDNTELEDSFKRTLYMLADTGSDANKLAEHFINGGGKMFTFESETNLSKEIQESDQYKSFLKKVTDSLKTEIADGSVNKKKADGTHEMLNFPSIALSAYGISDAFFKNDDAAAFIGGSQYCVIQYKLYEKEKIYTIKLTNVFVFDTFGTGWDDGCNTKKSYANGLLSMFVLQHYRNIGNPAKYQPFPIAVHIKYE